MDKHESMAKIVVLLATNIFIMCAQKHLTLFGGLSTITHFEQIYLIPIASKLDQLIAKFIFKNW